MCVTQCPVNKFIMDRNCSDACFGTRPLKYKENRKKGKTTCVSECPDGYLMHEKECLTADWCMRNDLMYTFKTLATHSVQKEHRSKMTLRVLLIKLRMYGMVFQLLYLLLDNFSSFFSCYVALKDVYVPASEVGG